MCILFWTVNNHPKYRFIFIGNRDEFLGRPTAPAHIWSEAPNDSTGTTKVVGGTDLEASASAHNGTWLGMTTNGRLAALTNFREPRYEGRRSRGILARDFLLGSEGVNDYMHRLQQEGDQYGGYSLVCFDLLRNEMACISNRSPDDQILPLISGQIYGLSNSVLSNPWTKVKQGQKEMDAILQDTALDEEQLIESLFQLLRMTKPFSNTQDINQLMTDFKERIFIPKLSSDGLGNGTSYATRTSAVVLVDKQDKVTFVERDWFELDDTGDRNSYRECNPPKNRSFIFHLNNPHIIIQ